MFSYRSQNDASYQIPKEVMEAYISPVHGYKVSGSGSTYGIKSPQIGSSSYSYSSSRSYNSPPVSGYNSYGSGHGVGHGYGSGGNNYGAGGSYGGNKGTLMHR